MISRPSSGGLSDSVSPECGPDNVVWKDVGVLLARPPDTPERRSHMVPFKRSDGPCNLGGARRSSVKKFHAPIVSCHDLKGLSLRYGGGLRFDSGEKAGLPSISSLKRLLNPE